MSIEKPHILEANEFIQSMANFPFPVDESCVRPVILIFESPLNEVRKYKEFDVHYFRGHPVQKIVRESALIGMFTETDVDSSIKDLIKDKLKVADHNGLDFDYYVPNI